MPARPKTRSLARRALSATVSTKGRKRLPPTRSAQRQAQPVSTGALEQQRHHEKRRGRSHHTARVGLNDCRLPTQYPTRSQTVATTRTIDQLHCRPHPSPVAAMGRPLAVADVPGRPGPGGNLSPLGHCAGGLKDIVAAKHPDSHHHPERPQFKPSPARGKGPKIRPTQADRDDAITRGHRRRTGRQNRPGGKRSGPCLFREAAARGQATRRKKGWVRTRLQTPTITPTMTASQLHMPWWRER